METTNSLTLNHSLLVPPAKKSPRKRSHVIITTKAAKSSSSSSSDNSWASVDESMVVLRNRIQEIKAMERGNEAPEDWAEWEKKHHEFYGECVFSFVGALQTGLMRTRPSLTVAIFAILALSVPSSLFMVMLQLVHLADGAF